MMAAPLPTWSIRAADGLRRLADRPWTLFALLLAVNAIARPYSGITHDARLYSLQALNQAEAGSYEHDVFLRYGSQDRFSLFSTVLGPLVAGFGVRSTFFAFYLVFNTLFLAALFRFIRTMVPDRLIATLALLYLAGSQLLYGGGEIFTVHEQFFTPRLVATTFTLFALERMLAGRMATALAWLAPAALVHPLMAFGGVLIWAGLAASSCLSLRYFAVIAVGAVIAFVALLFQPLLAEKIFGTMDEEWHHLIRLAVGYNYPDTWSAKDWLNIAVSFAVAIVAGVWSFPGDPVRRRFVLIAVLAGSAGLAVHVAASYLPCALLFQGQAYRVLWILKTLQVPLGFLLIAQWAQSPAWFMKLASVVLLAFFCVNHYLPQELAIILTATAGSMLLARFAAAEDGAEWGWIGAARGLVIGAIAWMAYRGLFFARNGATIAQHFDLNEWALIDLISDWLLMGIVAFWFCEPEAQARVKSASLACASGSLAILIPATLFAAEACPNFRRHHTRLGAEVAELRDYLHHHASADRACVYCPMNRPDLLWIDARSTSYFSIIQTAGVMFNRQTALEIDRRASLVAKFELAQMREEGIFLDDGKKIGLANFFKLDFNSPAPTESDLVRLCQEPGLDFVVVPQEFPGLYSARVGRLFLYECHRIGRLRLSARGELSSGRHLAASAKPQAAETRNSP